MTSVGGAREGDHVRAVGADLPPSGEQFEIEAGSFRAVLTEVGATLRTFDAGGVEVLDGFSATESSSAGRGQILAPWPNRLQDGRYSFEGVEGRAPLNEPQVSILPRQSASGRTRELRHPSLAAPARDPD